MLCFLNTEGQMILAVRHFLVIGSTYIMGVDCLKLAVNCNLHKKHMHIQAHLINIIAIALFCNILTGRIMWLGGDNHSESPRR